MAKFSASATALMSHGFTLIAPLREGEQPINSETTSALVRGESLPDRPLAQIQAVKPVKA